MRSYFSICCLLLLYVFILTGCASKKQEEQLEHAYEREIGEKLTLEADGETVFRKLPGELKLRVKNVSDENVILTETYFIEKKLSDGWHRVSYQGDVSFKDGDGLKPGDTLEKTVNLQYAYPDGVSSGSYRLVLEAENEEYPYEEYAAVSFTVE